MLTIGRCLGSRRQQRILAIVVCLGLASSSAAEDDAGSFVTEQTESFLGNAGSVGSLVGGILAGAAFANPFAPLGGTIIGFFLGKSTDASEAESNLAKGFVRPGFAPDSESGAVSQLALSDGNAGIESGDILTLGETAGVEATAAANVSSEDNSGNDGTLDTGSVSRAGNSESGEVEALAPVNLVITKSVGGDQEKLDELAAVIRSEQQRPEFVPHPQCPSGNAPRYRKKVAVAGFVVENPGHGVFGGLDQAGESVPGILYQHFLESGKVMPFLAPRWQMYASLDSAPTSRGFSNRLDKYSAVSREMGVQFVISGIIRRLDVQDTKAWDTSALAKMKRSVFQENTDRNFVVDVVVHDGYTGRVVLEQRYQASGAWDRELTDKVGFGSSGFAETGYGQAVNSLLADISDDVTGQLACQPMLVPVLQVSGQDLVLDIGTGSGLLPGDSMAVVRAESSWTNPDGPPRLVDTGVELQIRSLSLNSADAWMPEHSAYLNIRPGDYAVVY